MRLLLTLAAISILPSVCSARQVSLTVDSIPLLTDPQPTIRHGRLFIPASTFRKIGLAVDDRTPGEAMVGWPDSDVIWRFAANRNWVPGLVRPDRIKLQAVPFMRGRVLMVPLRKVLSGPPERIEWNNTTKTARIYRDQAWLRWRLAEDERLNRERPEWYETLR